MLVLSRRPTEKIVFPRIGVTLEVLRVQGSVVRIGIDAPRSLEVLREELVGGPNRPHAPEPSSSEDRHELCNRLSRITLGLHLFQKQREAGLQDLAEETLANVRAALESLDLSRLSDPPRAAAKPPAKPTHPVCRTLVVEDDDNERELLAGILAMNGCECATAADGAFALDYLASHERPDVVLLDMAMPRCDGVETLQAIRQDPRFDGMRIFSVSSTSPESLGIPTGPDGVEAWFPKPLNPGRLWEVIQNTRRDPTPN